MGQIPVPYVHGMTAGELAGMVHGERMMRSRPRLTVIRMEGWNRGMTWANTGLRWKPTSPNIPKGSSPLYYVATGILGGLHGVDIGIGTSRAFEFAAADGVDPQGFTRFMNAQGFSGVRFTPYSSTKKPGYGGCQIHIHPHAAADLVELDVVLTAELNRRSRPSLVAKTPANTMNLFHKVFGSDSLARDLRAGKTGRAIAAKWKATRIGSAAHAVATSRIDPLPGNRIHCGSSRLARSTAPRMVNAEMPSLRAACSPILIALCVGWLLSGCVAPPEATRKIKQDSLLRAAKTGLDVRKLQPFVNDRSAVILSGVDIEAVTRINGDTVAVQLDAEEGERLEVSFGLGAAISGDGYYLTAAHTVQEEEKNSDRIWLVRNVKSQPFARARVVWSDPKADLAIVKGDVRTAFFRHTHRLPPLGDAVFCHGKDAWPSAGKVTQVLFDTRRNTYVIEHDGPLKRGDSGGAAVNATGELIGINTEISWEGSTAVVAPPATVRSIIARDRRQSR